MEKRSRRLQTVLKLARIKQQQAAGRLGELTQAALAHADQEQQLKSYQSDYAEQFKSSAARGSAPALLRNFQGFYTQLEQAVETQQERVVLARDQRESARQEWQRLYARENTLENLVDRFASEEDIAEEKKLQREQDDRPPRKSP